MYQPLSLFIGLRYTRSKKRSHYVSFISLSSMLGIALGVLVLITVLSVMNGFDEQIQQKVFSMVPQLTIQSLNGKMKHWQRLKQTVTNYPEVTAVAPYVSGQGLIQVSGSNAPIYVTGIYPQYAKSIVQLSDKMVEGSFKALKAGAYGIILGQKLALNLGLSLGSKLLMLTPQASISPVGVLPRIKSLTVVGIFHASGGFGFDDSLGFMQLQDAQKLYRMGDAVSGLQVKVKHPFLVHRTADALAEKLPAMIQINDWTEQYGNFFHAVSMEKTMMFLILLLIIAIAAFNLVSSLVMVVNEKRADIAILRTFGASRQLVTAIFIIQGLVIGLFGVLLGVIGGVVLSFNVTRLVNGLQDLLHTQFISSDIYFIDYLPSSLHWTDVMHVAAIAFILSLVATIYPAWRASCIQPAEVLRYE
jgi:lipoprotein-releasing system permease protein